MGQKRGRGTKGCFGKPKHLREESGTVRKMASDTTAMMAAALAKIGMGKNKGVFGGRP